MHDWLQLLRPQQWTKNGFVLAPLLFSGRSVETELLAQAFLTLLAFSVTASGVYAINDVVDAAADRLHPVKRERPVAAGRIDPRAAAIVGGGLVLAGLGVAYTVSLPVGGLIGAYVILTALYSAWLKSIVLLDVFSIGAFFLLRLLAGSAAVDVRSSFWLLLCGGLLSLYLGFAKRRHELGVLGSS